MDINKMRLSVHEQFIQQYVDRFDAEVGKIPSELHIAKALYLFAYSDYFGKIMYVADNADISRIEHSKNSFCYLIDNYFPVEWKELGEKIYVVYRCGVMHSVYPKYSGINYIKRDERIFLVEEVGVPGQRYLIEVMNLWKYEMVLSEVISFISSNILSGKEDEKVININKLFTGDIFGDEAAARKYAPVK